MSARCPADRVFMLGCAALAGSCAIVAPLAAGLGLVLGLALLWRSGGSPRWCALLALAFALSTAHAWHTLTRFEARRVLHRDALGGPSRCVVRGRVIGSPTVRSGTTLYSLDVSLADCEGRLLPLPLVTRLYGGPSALGRGDQVEAIVDLAPVRPFRNADLPDPLPSLARTGITLSGGVQAVTLVEGANGLTASIDSLRAFVRGRILARFAPEAAPLARALVLGENDLDEPDALAFQQSGLAHLLAVSGAHLVFAVLSLVAALRYVLLRVDWLARRYDVGRIAAAFGALLALLYADFAGGSGSAWRAAWMLTTALAARSFSAVPRGWRSLGWSLVIGVAVDPLVGFDLSFLLSAAATAGLLGAQRGAPPPPSLHGVGDSLQRAAVLLKSNVLATLAALGPCLPLLALMAPTVTLAGVAANLFAAPFGEAIALPLCLAYGFLFPWPWLEQSVALVASVALLVVKRLAELTAAQTWLAVPMPMPTRWHMLVLALSTLGYVSVRWREPLSCQPALPRRAAWATLGCLGLVAVEVACHRAGYPRGQLRVTALDVGQGDATLVDLPDGQLVLIDGGGFVGSPTDPGARVLLPVLRARRRSQLDAVILSHPHPDHFGGLLKVVEQVPVGQFWDTGQGLAEGAGPVYAELLRALTRRGVAVLGPSQLCGAFDWGGASFQVLAPCPAITPGLGANDNSWVFRVRFGSRAVLFTGDAEHHEEQRLLAQHPQRLAADLLKVGHHGSRTSTGAGFLAAVGPRWATISCGLRNRFGHPHPETLQTLEQSGVHALRLDRTGSVQWSTDGQAMWLSVFDSEAQPEHAAPARPHLATAGR